MQFCNNPSNITISCFVYKNIYYNWAVQLITHMAVSLVTRINSYVWACCTDITPKLGIYICKTKVEENVFMEIYHILILYSSNVEKPTRYPFSKYVSTIRPTVMSLHPFKDYSCSSNLTVFADRHKITNQVDSVGGGLGRRSCCVQDTTSRIEQTSHDQCHVSQNDEMIHSMEKT